MPETTTPEPLIDPDCDAGKHGSCVGGPCECMCHDPAPTSQRHDPPFDATCGERVALLGVAHACRLEAHEGDGHVCVCGCEWWPHSRGCASAVATPVDLLAFVRRAINDPGKTVPREDGESVGNWSARAVLADLAQLLDPGDLPDRMLTAARDTGLVYDRSALIGFDWEDYLKAVVRKVMSVRWEDHVATIAQLAQALARADHAEKAAVLTSERLAEARRKIAELRRSPIAAEEEIQRLRAELANRKAKTGGILIDFEQWKARAQLAEAELDVLKARIRASRTAHRIAREVGQHRKVVLLSDVARLLDGPEGPGDAETAAFDPKCGDVWRDRYGHSWFVISEQSGDFDFDMVCETGSTDYPNDVESQFGPLIRTYRRETSGGDA